MILQINVQVFHAQTPLVRSTFGGEHAIEFTFLLYDVTTGALVYGPASRDLTFAAYGGRRAVEAEAMGLTHRARIEAWVHNLMISEFRLPVAPSGVTF